MVLGISMTGQQFFASVTVNGVTYSNVPFSPNIFVYPEKAYKEYVAFTSRSTEDMMMLSLNRDGSIRQFNDDNDISSNYIWGTEPRITDYPQANNVALLIVFPKDLNTQGATTDVYTRCWVNYGRSATSSEMRDVTYADYVTTDTISSYNSMAWACGRWLEWVDYVYNQDISEWSFYDSLLGHAGFTRTGATDANSDIDVFVGMKSNPLRPYITNMTVKSSSHPLSRGYDWESKLGTGKRFMHERLHVRSSSYSGSGFGTIMYYYRKYRQPVELLPLLYENVAFSVDEISMIEDMAASVPLSDRIWFQEKYVMVKEAFESSCSSTLLTMEDDETYLELLQACLRNDLMMSLVYEKLDEGELIPCLLVYDVMQATDPGILSESRLQCGTGRTNNGQDILRNIQSEATACAKILLARKTEGGSGFLLSTGRSYSDDLSAFTLTVRDKCVTVKFELDRPAKVLLRMDTQQGLPVTNAYNRQKLTKGTYEATLNTYKRGTYIVSLLINGQICLHLCWASCWYPSQAWPRRTW